MTPTSMVRAPSRAVQAPPFAAIPHDIAADPRLTPVDVRVIAALLFWARDKAACWPCDRSIASRVGRSVPTVQRALRRLQALGLVDRDKVEPSPTPTAPAGSSGSAGERPPARRWAAPPLTRERRREK